MSIRNKEEARKLAMRLRKGIKKNDMFYRDFIKYIKGNNLLEIGCTAGHVLEYIHKKIPRLKLYGVDIEPLLIIEGRKKFPLAKYELIKGHKLPYKNNYFDNILLSYVMHEIIDKKGKKGFKKSLEECYRVLKPNGRIIIKDFMYSGNNVIIDKNKFDKYSVFKFFIKKYKNRKIKFKEESDRISLSQRDFNEFFVMDLIFKSKFKGQRMKFEMDESHFPVSDKELIELCKKAKLKAKVHFIQQKIPNYVIKGDKKGISAVIVCKKV